MAEAIISGIIRSGAAIPGDISISDRDGKRLTEMASKYGANIVHGNVKAVEVSDIIILAVKPQVKPAVLKEISGADLSGKMFISIAAGISIAFLEKELGKAHVVRVMPNNPCLVGKGMSVLSKGKYASDDDMRTAEKIFSSLGETMVLEEGLLDAVTGLSGSGPAFVYSAIQGMIKGGEHCGITHADSKRLAVQTFLGAVHTISETGKSANELMDMVASPGGTTVEGLKVLREYKFEEAMQKAVVAAAERAAEIRSENDSEKMKGTMKQQ